MAYSYIEHAYSGGARTFSTGFATGVGATAHLRVSVEGEVDGLGNQVEGEVDGLGNQVYRAFTYNSGTGVVTVTDAISGPYPKTVKIERATPITTPDVDYPAGAEVSRAHLQEQTLQLLRGVQEAHDRTDRLATTLPPLFDAAALATALTPYTSRAAAQQAAISSSVTKIAVVFEGRVYEYLRGDSTDTALVTAGNVRWRPAAEAYAGHWGYGTSGAAYNINPAVEWVAAHGEYYLNFIGIVTINATVVQPSNVVLRGVGQFVSGLRAMDGLNADMVKTKNFDALTGTNTWLVSGTGLPYGFGLENMQLDGNKANNTSGRGWVVYGKGYVFDCLLIHNTAQEAWYSECAYAGGQTAVEDLPEGRGGSITIKDIGTRGTDGCNGAIFRGPHDMRIASITVAVTDGTGIMFESLLNTYNGKCDVGFIHSYGCYRKGVAWGAGGSAAHIIGESSDEEGVRVHGSSAQIGMIESYRNCIRSASTGRGYGVYVDGDGHSISQIETRDSTLDEGGVNVTGSYCVIGIHSDGQGTSSKTGVRNTGSGNKLTGVIKGFSLSGGKALALEGDFNIYDFTVANCATAVHLNTTAGIGIRCRVVANLEVGQQLFGGIDPVSGSALNKSVSRWDVSGKIGAAYTHTRTRKKSGGSFDAAAAVGTTGVITITHDLAFAPDPEDVQLTAYVENAGAAPAGTPAVALVLNGPPTTGQISVRWRIINPATAPALGYVIASVEY